MSEIKFGKYTRCGNKIPIGVFFTSVITSVERHEGLFFKVDSENIIHIDCPVNTWEMGPEDVFFPSFEKYLEVDVTIKIKKIVDK